MSTDLANIPQDQELSPRYDSSNIEVIEQYFASGGEGVVLTDFQKKILERRRFADELIRQNQGVFKREEIANYIKVKFEVTRDTAYKDIVNAERVFSSSYPLNKRYEVGCRIEFLKEQIKQAADDKDRDGVARLEKVLQEYYETYPDLSPKRTKKNIVLNIIQNNITTANTGAPEMTIEDALVIAEKTPDTNE